MNLFNARTHLRSALITALFTLSTVSLSANWSLGFKAGLAPITLGDVHRGPSFDGSVLLGLPAGSLPVDVDAKSFGDVYGNFEEIAFEASYEAGEKLATPAASIRSPAARLPSSISPARRSAIST